jgi:hypothetical protein
MVLEKSDRTVRGITANDLLHIHPSNLEDLKNYGFTLAQPISIQVSARAARTLILQVFGLSRNTKVGFSRKHPQVWFRDRSTGEVPIEPLCQLVVSRARQLAEAIGSKVTQIRYLRSQDQDPRLLVSLEPADQAGM